MPRVCGIAAEVSAMNARTMTESMTVSAAKTIAVARIATGNIFFLFAEYKIAGNEFTPGGFIQWVGGWVEQGQPVRFFRPVLVNLALVHPAVCARIVAWGELAIAVSLMLGLLVRPASAWGGIFMISLALSTWFAPGRGAPVWQYFGANLDHISLLLLFVVFYATRAGTVWGLDGRLRRAT